LAGGYASTDGADFTHDVIDGAASNLEQQLERQRNNQEDNVDKDPESEDVPMGFFNAAIQSVFILFAQDD
jgi:hypothetical protein